MTLKRSVILRRVGAWYEATPADARTIHRALREPFVSVHAREVECYAERLEQAGLAARLVHDGPAPCPHESLGETMARVRAYPARVTWRVVA